ncbi:MAG: AraC family transcriptional regulator [Burkholderiales bacterium]|nr:AraC family transcriptional regulator [Burkholderiales bacterium]
MLRSQDVEETRAFLGCKGIDLELPSTRTSLDFSIGGAYLSGLWLGYVRYGAPAKVAFSPRSSVWRSCDPAAATGATGNGAASCGVHWIQLPLHGALEASVAGRVLDCGTRCGVVVSPADRAILRSEADSGRLSVSIREDALVMHLAGLLGDAPAAPLRFDPEMAIDGGAGQRLYAILRWAASELDAGGMLADPRVAGEFERFVMSWLLASQPSNYSQALRKRDRPVAPRDVKRAIDYIHANLAEPITLACLVRASGVAGRTLLKHFREVHGVSPMRFVRNLRLQRVREELAAGKVDRVVTSAMRWGFSHPGRFAADYRRRYGESPSATLANGHARK